MITIEQALSKLPYYKSEYFRWKFNISFKTDRSVVTEEQLLKRIGRTTMDIFKRWERTEEYKKLVDIYLNGKSANDLLEVYEIVSKNAKEGDSKSIDQLLKLQKEIQQNAKLANKNLTEKKKKKSKEAEIEKEDDDGLII